MISQTAEYALRAVTCLARDRTIPHTTNQIAEQSQVPSGYLCKVLQILTKSGIVKSQRGLHGGYILNQSPDTLTMLDVINAVDPLNRRPGCPLGMSQHDHKPCALHARLDEAINHVESVFSDYTVTRLMQDMEHDAPLGQKR